MSRIKTLVFDLGGVMIEWNPDYLYRTLIADEKQRRRFLSEICTPDWNEEQDAGRSIQEGTDLLVAQFPEHEANIPACDTRWLESLGEPVHGALEIVKQLKESGKYKIYAVTNGSPQTIPMAQVR